MKSHKQILDKIKNGEPQWITNDMDKEHLRLCKEISEKDIDLMKREANAINLLRKPRYYIIIFIFFRYRIPIFYHKVINFITGR